MVGRINARHNGRAYCPPTKIVLFKKKIIKKICGKLTSPLAVYSFAQNWLALD